MALLTVEITGPDFAVVQRAVRALTDRAAMNRYGEAIRINTRKRMVKGVDVEDTPFTALSDSYRPHKRGPGILRETSALFKSIFVEDRRDEAEVGTRINYGTWHQTGIEETNLPQREWLGVTDDDVDDVEDAAIEIWEGAFDV